MKSYQGFEKILGSHKQAFAKILQERQEELRTGLINQRNATELIRLQGRAEEIDALLLALNQ